MSRLLFAVVFSIPLQVSAQWEPPPNPDPDRILHEAEADAKAGRFADALARQLWFHHHALEYDPSLDGVRLVIALPDWFDLGKAYPPAMKALEETRDAAAQQVLDGKGDTLRAFQEMRSINRVLGSDDETVATFVQLDKQAPETAKKVYILAQPALVRAKRYSLCGKYLRPESDYAELVEWLGIRRKYAEQQKSSSERKSDQRMAEQTFLQDVGTLIALLVLNKEKPVAEKTAEWARTESKSSNRDTVIDAALEGTFPKQD
jgi:hypothetical protein